MEPLLTPEGNRQSDTAQSDDQSNQPSTSDNNTPVGAQGLFEKLHNVTDREALPAAKKQKLNDGKSQSFKGSKGGVIGQYLKEQRDEGARQAGPPSAIDLTADDDDEEDDDLQVVSVKSTALDPNREICLGSITAKVMAHRVPAANKVLSKHSTNWPTARMTLRPMIGQEKTFTATDAKGGEFGKLDNISATALAPLLKAQSHNGLRYTTLLKERPKGDEQPGQTTSKPMDISITLFAFANAAQGIGRHLSKRMIYLYKPLIVPHGTEILNPHVPNVKVIPTKGNASSTIAVQSAGYRSRTTEEIKSDVLSMFDRLGKMEELPEAEADATLVKTELMQHQKQALWFLSKHETPTPPEEDPLWKFAIRKNGNRAWYNVITGDELGKVSPILGGLLADQMGLGKTLSILSLICATLQEARDFGDGDLDEHDRVNEDIARRSGGTLLLCPKSVISNWQEQIGQHLDNAKVNYYMYHGNKREQDLDILAQHDIVVTSYSIAASEFTSSSKNYSALGQLAWFRIVLDEAHMIRNQDTTTFKAACALVSKRRWAVTGTPVQNRLDDFGALIKFLKIYPFADKGIFEKHFMAPFKSGDPQVLDNLRLLVSSITLRRSKDKIDLPDRVEEIVRLEFSSEEQALYDAFAKDANKKVRAMTRGSNRLRGRSYAHVLVNITRLRLLCAHGRELLSEDDMKVLQGTSYETAIDLGDEEDAEKAVLTKEQIYDTFYLLRESTMDICSCCMGNIGRMEPAAEDDSDSSSDEDDDAEDIIGYLTPCLHLVCPACSDVYMKGMLETRTRDNYAHCPQCEQYIKAVMHPISQKTVDDDLSARQKKKGQQKSKKGVEYGGPHTKVKALLSDLHQYVEDSRELIELGEAPIRSVVFSGWTSYLDLIEIALKDAKIGFLRLDGKMSVSARTQVLDRFKTDTSIYVCLVSIKAGGQGLNFTAASNVFMMEPQFNPGVEMQAVDRVHRLGQKRKVHIRRFIMANSFEEKIVELQKKKIELANLATGGKAVRQDAKEIFQNLMSLF
jgi:SNF2 family DNA or RNA helicase